MTLISRNRECLNMPLNIPPKVFIVNEIQEPTWLKEKPQDLTEALFI